MSEDCFFLNPLRRDGTSQRQRMVAALAPSAAPVDQRTLCDFLIYLRRYARLLRYYSPNNTPGGDWLEFLERDPSTQLAIIQSRSTEEPRKEYERLRRTATEATEADFPAAFAALFPHTVELARTFDGWYLRAVEGLSLEETLRRLIDSVLVDSLRALVAYAERSRQLIPLVQPIDVSVFSDAWKLSGIEADPSLFPSEDLSVAAERREAVKRVATAYDRFHEALVHVVGQASGYLGETLTAFPRHQPHMALLLAFLQLFQKAQEHLNTITAKHLDFYYKEVLALAPRGAEADRVHLVFELAKSFTAHKLAADTQLKAGKDATGVELLYATDEELAVNQASLDATDGLKTVFVEKVTADEDADSAGAVKNIYAAKDADSADGEGAEIEDEEGKWQTFGGVSMPYAEIGFAVASPMLLLAEGTRTITLELTLSERSDFLAGKSRAVVKTELANNVEVYASGAKEWLEVDVEAVELSAAGETPSVEYTLVIGADQDAVVAYDAKTLGGSFATDHPVLKFVLDNEGLGEGLTGEIDDYSDEVAGYAEGDLVRYQHKVYLALRDVGAGFRPPNHLEDDYWREVVQSYAYKYFQAMELAELHIHVKVEGLRSLILENDLGVLDPAKPFHPFGPIPKAKSGFLIGSPEVFHKAVTSLSLSLTWADLPEVGFAKHYEDYTIDSSAVIDGNDDFTAEFSVLEGGDWKNPETRQLFTSSSSAEAPSGGFARYVLYRDAVTGHFVSKKELDRRPRETTKEIRWMPSARAESSGDEEPAPASEITIELSPGLERAPELPAFERFGTGLRQGFLRARLDRSFLHEMYAPLLAKMAATSPPDVPNPPYTPLMASLSLTYEAEETIAYGDLDKDDFTDRLERLFQIGPFGHREVYPIADDPTATEVPIDRKLVPEFTVTVDKDGKQTTTTAEGSLLIGLDKLDPPQNLALLFQVAEGSEDPLASTQEVRWSYMTADEGWQEFTSSEVLSDGTNGLLTSGVIKFSTPRDMARSKTVLPAGLHWIKAAVADESRAVPKLIAIHPQAVTASFRDQDNDPSHLATPLEAETIAKMKSREAAIKSVTQPYASFGGRTEEADESFYTRVSERLRHKGRAVTIFDYERLVLETFPEVYKVRCVNHTGRCPRDSTATCEHNPGLVKLILVPDLRNKNAVDPLQPRLSRNKLESIRRYLQELASDFVTIEVANPDYEPIQVRFDVRFMAGRDKGLYTRQLDEEIVGFLSPWLYDEAADLTFGGRIHRSSILDFVEKRDYVDFVVDFEMFHLVGVDGPDVEEAEATSSSAALVSAASHEISHETVSCQDAETA